MSKQILWDTGKVRRRIEDINECVRDYDRIPQVTHTLSEGMEVMESFAALQKRMQILFDQYFRMLEVDAGNLQQIVIDIIETDFDLAGMLEGSRAGGGADITGWWETIPERGTKSVEIGENVEWMIDY